MTMDVNYGVAVANKFALFLNEDEDPLDILRVQEENRAKKVDKKTDKDAKTKTKTSKTDAAAAVDQKKPTAAAATTTAKKDDKTSVRKQARPTQGESAGADKREGKENDAPKRERRDEPGNRPRPQSGPPRDAAPRDGFSRPEQGERGGFQSRPYRGTRPQRFERGGFAEGGERPEFGGSEKVEDGEGIRGAEFRRGGGRGRGAGRGGGGGGGFRGGKREYDRHSGSDRREQLTANQPNEETATWGAQMEAADSQPTTEGAKPEEAGVEANHEGDAAEQEKVLTLDEWKAQQGTQRLKMEFKIRKAGEGCAADPQWKKMVALIKKKDEEEEEEEEGEEEEEAHHGRQKTTVPIEIKFNQTPRRGFGGRGGRGRGGRGGGGGGEGAPGEERRGRGGPGPVFEGERRGGPRVGREQKAPSLSDEHDFPSLVGAVTH